MATPVEEFAAFNISEGLKLAKEENDLLDASEKSTTVHVDGKTYLTVRGWYRIILHEEKRIMALKRQVNRLIAGNTIEGDGVPYPDEECWVEDQFTGADFIRAAEDQRFMGAVSEWDAAQKRRTE
jgi:hypothetical protein